MGFEDFFNSLFGGQIGNVVSGIGGAAAQNKIIKDIESAGQQDFSTIFGQNYQLPDGGLIGQAERATEFKPFTVTTPTGTSTLGKTGDVSLGLTPEQIALQEQLSGFTKSAFETLGSPEARAKEQANIIGMLTQDPAQRATREQELYNRIRATQTPEEQREALALEEKLFNQGRLGVSTAMYGGTPEQLARAKAVEEAKAGASIDAITQARLEQALGSEQTLAGLRETRERLGLFGDLGLQGLFASYLPQDKMLEALSPSLDAARIRSALQSTGATLGAQLGETGLEAQLGYFALVNALRQQQFQGLFDLLKGEQAASAPAKTSSSTPTLTGNAAVDAAIAMYGGIPRNTNTTLTGNDAVDAAISMYGGIPRG